MAFYLGDFGSAVPSLEESRRLAEEGGSKQGVARALCLLGEMAALQDPSSADDVLEQSVALAREAGDGWCLAYSLASRAWTDLNLGNGPSGRPFIDESLAIARAAGDTRNLLRGSLCRAWAACLEGSYEDGGDAQRAIELGLKLARQLGDLGWTALLLSGQGELTWRRGDYGRARLLLDESLEIGRQLDSPNAIAPPMGLLGRLCKARGDLDEAAAHFEEALEISRQAGMHMFVPWWLWGRADVYRLAGDTESSLAWMVEARAAAEAVGNEHVVAFTSWARARIARGRGCYDEAEALDLEALRRRQAVGDGAGILDSLESLAGLAAVRGDAAKAARLLSAADAHRILNRCARPVPQQAEHDADQALAWSALPAGAFDVAWAAGHGLSRDEAVALALGPDDPPA